VTGGRTRRLRWFVRETIALVSAQRATSAVVVLSVVALSAGLVVTAGRTRAAETALMDRMQSAEHRQVLIRVSGPAVPDAGPVVDVLERVKSVEWAVALGPAVDVRNAALPGGAPVAMRAAAGTRTLDLLGMEITPEAGVYVSGAGQVAAGLASSQAGAFVDAFGAERIVRSAVDLPSVLDELGPVALEPVETSTLPSVSLVAFSVRSIDDVDAVSEVAVELFPSEHRRSLQVERAGELLSARNAVREQFSALGPALLAALLAATGTCVAAGVLGGVLARRRDYGRRRALGATRGLLAMFVAVHAVILSAAGAVAGTGGAVVYLLATGSPAPPVDFVVAVLAAAVTIGAAASVLPALAASRRDPLRELRVP